jgi:zinc transport system permease protein
LGAAAAVCGGLYLSLRFDTAAGPSIVIALAALFFLVAAPALAFRGR